jgi:hypothetical protein
LALYVVGKKVASDPNIAISNLEVRLQERHEEPDHLGIRVREANLIWRPFRSFCPIEHATRQMQRFAAPGKLASALPRGSPLRSMMLSDFPPTTELSVVSRIHRLQDRDLLRRQLDVAHPEAHRGLRDADTTGDLVDRKPFVPPKSSCVFSFLCFHF